MDVVFKLWINNLEFVDKLFKLLKMVVDVVFKLLVNNVEFVDKLFKLFKVVVDVACRLDIFNAENEDTLFKFESVANVDPLTVNDDKIVALLTIKLYALISYTPELL